MSTLDIICIIIALIIWILPIIIGAIMFLTDSSSKEYRRIK